MNAEKNEGLFLQFVMSLMQSGMIQLGKVMNPMTQKVERDLDGAKATIDMLMMLKEKTSGNLSQTEQNFLTNALSSLQMNYVDELDAEKKHVKSEKAGGEEPGKETPPEQPAEEKAAGAPPDQEEDSAGSTADAETEQK